MPRAQSRAQFAALLHSPIFSGSPALRRSAALALAGLMLATRQCHFGLLSDASWAVFFLGGFYVGGSYPFAAFMAGAVGIDYIATQHLGISSYCLSPAYVFLLPAYAALWMGGIWAARHWRREQPLHSVASLAAILWLSASLCFLISNASFYWLSARVAAPSLSGWSVNFRDWYGAFLAVPFVYTAVAAAAQLVADRVAMRSQLLRRA